MVTSPAVTVLMAVHDAPAGLLGQAVESILRQTFVNFEFLIIDDGSRNEPTRAALRAHASRDARIRVLWEPHRGLTRTLNLGLQAACGEWIARQDADDWSDRARLERQLHFLEANPSCGLCGTAAWTHREDGRTLWPVAMPVTGAEILSAFPRRNPFVHGSTMFRAETARALGGYRDRFPCSQDYDFFWRFAEREGAANLPEALYHYRYSGGAVSVTRAVEQELAHRAARILAATRAEGRPEDVAGALAQARLALAQGAGPLRAALKQADHRMLAGDFLGAGRDFVDLLRSYPAAPAAWGKLARWALYSSFPPARKLCFR